MGKAIPVALLLLFGAGGVAAADNLSDRFNDAFGDAPPAENTSPAVAPTAPPAPSPAASELAVPKPKLRHAPHPPVPPVDGASPAAPPAAAAVAPPKPAVKRVKPLEEAKQSASIPDGYQVSIAWNALDPTWEGMFVTNSGATPVSVLGLVLNNRKDCTLKPYSLEKIQKLISVQDAVKQWGHEAINLFGLPKMDVGSVIVPELPAALQGTGITPEEPRIKAGGRVAIFNGTKCDKVAEARIDTDVGSIAIKFKRPYTGH